MHAREDLLSALTRDELAALAAQLDHPVAGSRKRDLVVSLSSANGALDAALTTLARDRLKELCRKLDRADVAIVVCDASEGLTSEDLRVAELAMKAGCASSFRQAPSACCTLSTRRPLS